MFYAAWEQTGNNYQEPIYQQLKAPTFLEPIAVDDAAIILWFCACFSHLLVRFSNSRNVYEVTFISVRREIMS